MTFALTFLPRRGRWLEAKRRDGGGSRLTLYSRLAPSTASRSPSPDRGGIR